LRVGARTKGIDPDLDAADRFGVGTHRAHAQRGRRLGEAARWDNGQNHRDYRRYQRIACQRNND
jgi:hypothetical protein